MIKNSFSAPITTLTTTLPATLPALAATAIFTAASVSGADAASRFDGMTVTPIDQTRFEVSGVPRRTPASYWCAAARYAQSALGADFSQRLYVVGDYQRGQRSFVISLNPAGTASEAGRIKQFAVSIDGANVRLDQGLAYCRDLRSNPGN